MELVPIIILSLIMTIEAKGAQNIREHFLENSDQDKNPKAMNIRKRETTSQSSEKNIQDMLSKQTNVLEHLVHLVNSNEDLMMKLIDKLGTQIGLPKLPEKFGPTEQVSRRSNESKDSSRRSGEISRWCAIASLCNSSEKYNKKHVCAFDNKFGYAKFEGVCHMLQVNCYWNYDFVMVANCEPTFYL